MDRDTSSPLVSESTVIAGWGEVSLVSAPSDSLQQAVVQGLNPSTCGISSTNASQFCASYDVIRTCPTDNGGPLMTAGNNS